MSELARLVVSDETSAAPKVWPNTAYDGGVA